MTQPTYTVERSLPSGAVMRLDGWTLAMIGRAAAAGVPVTITPKGLTNDG